MIVAVATNNGKTISKHLALSKKIAFYNFPEVSLIKTVPNPIMQMIKENNIKLEKNSSGVRHLKVGQKLPRFLAEQGADVFIAQTLGEGFKQNLLRLGILPILTDNKNIEEAIKAIEVI
jgi:predicted Fe-Mo cluster-binding NifX family protein